MWDAHASMKCPKCHPRSSEDMRGQHIRVDQPAAKRFILSTAGIDLTTETLRSAEISGRASIETKPSQHAVIHGKTESDHTSEDESQEQSKKDKKERDKEKQDKKNKKKLKDKKHKHKKDKKDKKHKDEQKQKE
eukprot:TRINITY_DN31716_c0_g1_i1.p1 TRINITY_DN31716_c0_g1~~TRINITY_DN31716_c0_g1_i1.p1  ORF type:complete len:146 (-),score=39.42 TRINITY_DN31716_c0_g1_i1:146-547(-)